MCGEKLKAELDEATEAGSPPRVRGKERFSRLRWLHERITPACAGKSVNNGTNHFCAKDHPRVCGEKKLLYSPDLFFRGSPPRVRGKEVLIPKET